MSYPSSVRRGNSALLCALIGADSPPITTLTGRNLSCERFATDVKAIEWGDRGASPPVDTKPLLSCG
jgi:hypothetical protein